MSNSKAVIWQKHGTILNTTHDLHLIINHAYFGHIPSFRGTNNLLENRLYFCLDDCGRLQWIDLSGENRTLYLQPGSITFMPGSIDLTYEFTSGRMVAFHFSLEVFPGLDVFNEQFECQQLRNSWEACSSIYKMMCEDSLSRSFFSIHGQLIQTAALFNKIDLKSISRKVVLRKKYAHLLLILSDRLDATITIGEISHTLGLGRDQLSKAFRRDVGISLKSYLTLRLIRKASKLLIGASNVKKTAEELAFSSEFYFSRFFRKHTGMSPSEYLKQYMIIR